MSVLERDRCLEARTFNRVQMIGKSAAVKQPAMACYNINTNLFGPENASVLSDAVSLSWGQTAVFTIFWFVDKIQ